MIWITVRGHMKAYDALLEESRQIREEAKRTEEHAAQLLANRVAFCGRGYIPSQLSNISPQHNTGETPRSIR